MRKRKRKNLLGTREEFYALTDDDIAAAKERDRVWAESIPLPVAGLKFKKSRRRKPNKPLPPGGGSY